MSPISIGQFQTAAANAGRVTQGGQEGEGPTLENSTRNGKTRAVGWLKNLPGIRDIATVRADRTQRTSENKQVMQSFMQALKAEYGDEIGTAVVKDIDRTGAKSLTARTIRTAIDAADVMSKTRESRNNMNVMRFLDSPMAGGTMRLPGETDMNGLLLDKGVQLDPLGWQETFPGAQKYLEGAIKAEVKAHPDYSRGQVGNGEIADIAARVFDRLQNLDSHILAGGKAVASLYEDGARPAPGQLLQNLRGFVDDLMIKVETSRIPGKHVGADDSANMVGNAMKGFLDTLSPDEAANLYGALKNDPSITDLIRAFELPMTMELSERLDSAGVPSSLNPIMLGKAINVKGMTQALVMELDKRSNGNDEDSVAFVGGAMNLAVDSLSELTEPMFSAVMDHMKQAGLPVGEMGLGDLRAAPGGRISVDIGEAALADRQTFVEGGLTGNGLYATFEADLGRANFIFGGQEVSRDEDAKAAGIQGIADFCTIDGQTDDAMKAAISQVAHQGMLANPLTVMIGEMGGMPAMGGSLTTYNVARGDGGEVTVDISYSSKVTHLTDITTGELKELDADKSNMNMSFRVTLTPQEGGAPNVEVGRMAADFVLIAR